MQGKVSTTDSPRVWSSSPVRGSFFLYFFSTVIHFLQIWQNDLITEKLDWLNCSWPQKGWQMRSESPATPPESINKVHSSFDTQSRHQQKSKTGESIAPQKGLMSSKNFLTKIITDLHFYHKHSFIVNL